ncbi:MAG: Hpt domain-containing protein [Kiritimatiellae bacterium]|nr:Hpt domain-containing protein [Kiritimatiellia bacterium]
MNDYLENPVYRKAFFEDADRIIADFQKDYSLYKSGENKEEALKNIHRYAHSIKGLSAMMELADVCAMAENLESVLRKILKEGIFDLDAGKKGEIDDGFNKIAGLLKRIKDNSKD